MGPTVVDRLNDVLDRLPRDHVTVGARTLPAFRSLGVAGFHVAVPTAVLAGLRAGVPVLDVVGLSATAACSFFGWAVLRRALTGRETLVLFEHVWVALAAVAAYLAAAGVPVRPGLDALAVALCPFLAAGRLGCLTVGCCHGVPSGIGVVYRGVRWLPDRLAGVRLFPVQALEAVALLAIGVVGLVLAGGRPGTATVWCLLAYATVRFGAEALRGDARPAVLGVRVARAAAVAQFGLAVVLSEAWLVPGGPGRRDVAAAVPLAAALVAGLALDRRRRDPLAAGAHLDEVWATVRRLAAVAPGAGGDPVVATTGAGVRVAASWGLDDRSLQVSFSHPDRAVAGLPGALGLVPLAATATATHAVVPADRLGRASPQGGGAPAPGRTYDVGRRRAVDARDPLGAESPYFASRADR